MYLARAELGHHIPQLGPENTEAQPPTPGSPIHTGIPLASFHGFSLQALLSFQTWKQLR